MVSEQNIQINQEIVLTGTVKSLYETHIDNQG